MGKGFYKRLEAADKSMADFSFEKSNEQEGISCHDFEQLETGTEQQITEHFEDVLDCYKDCRKETLMSFPKDNRRVAKKYISEDLPSCVNKLVEELAPFSGERSDFRKDVSSRLSDLSHEGLPSSELSHFSLGSLYLNLAKSLKSRGMNEKAIEVLQSAVSEGEGWHEKMGFFLNEDNLTTKDLRTSLLHLYQTLSAREKILNI